MDGGYGPSDDWPRLSRRESAKKTFTMPESRTRSASPDTLFVSEHDDRYTRPGPPPQRRWLSPQRLDLPPRTHFPGDGYDLRTPLLSPASTSQHRTHEHAPPSLVIDLTDDADTEPVTASPLLPANVAPAESSAVPPSSRATRGPRFGRNIIDVEHESDEPGHETMSAARDPPRNNYDPLFPRYHEQLAQPHPQYSVLRRPQRRPTPWASMDDDFDDIEFLDSRPASQARNRPPSRAPRSVTPYPNGQNEPIDLTGDDDEVQHVNTRVRRALNLDRPSAVAGTRTRSIADNIVGLFGNGGTGARNLVHRLSNYVGGDLDHAHPEPVHRHVYADVAPPRTHIHFGGPLMDIMDYEAPGFDLGYPGANGPHEPKYEPPKDSEKGFTRSPGEDEVVVCPNCGDELAMGDSDLKQQVWVVKKCGHAYCGLCAENRTKTTAVKSKGKGKAPDAVPFKKCVVHGCGAPTSKTSMLHVYLGS